ncbi:hypothetical protein, partial [Mesomycoplasma ovipneumoniae]|uniref:hypothetical protein n=1 Tax=Mesomycoplasma ovipneumoniae TaxID=29562 RepID=UPI003080A2DF
FKLVVWIELVVILIIFAVLALVINDFLSSRLCSVSSSSISSSTIFWESTLTKTGSKLLFERRVDKVATPDAKAAEGAASFSYLTALILYLVDFFNIKNVK